MSLINSCVSEKVIFNLSGFYKLFPVILPQIIFHPTFVCNYRCSYCTNQLYEPLYPRASEVDYTQWLELFQEIPRSYISVSGGEPLLYDGLIKLLFGLSKRHIISKVISNISGDLTPFIETRKIGYRIIASFHPEMTFLEDFGKRLLFLKKAGFRLMVNCVATVDNIKNYDGYKDYIEKKLKIFFRFCAHESLGEELDIKTNKKINGLTYAMRKGYFNNFNSKLCYAGSKYLVILPNADVFRCMAGCMYCTEPDYKDVAAVKDLKQFYLGNLKAGTFQIRDKRFSCHSPCKTVCDIELAKVRIY